MNNESITTSVTIIKNAEHHRFIDSCYHLYRYCRLVFFCSTASGWFRFHSRVCHRGDVCQGRVYSAQHYQFNATDSECPTQQTQNICITFWTNVEGEVGDVGLALKPHSGDLIVLAGKYFSLQEESDRLGGQARNAGHRSSLGQITSISEDRSFPKKKE